MPIEMEYRLERLGQTKSYLPILEISGQEPFGNFARVILAACNPVKFGTAMMKRAHSIAQGGKVKKYRKTDSHFWGAAFYGGELRDAAGNWGSWTGDPDHTKDQGAYPYPPPPPIVSWFTPVGKEFYQEADIECDTRYMWQ